MTDSQPEEVSINATAADTSDDGRKPDMGRRRRRSREDVEQRICVAARQLFAQRGYHGATTREIARLADVSETLLFRYFGSKSTLFDEVVAQPFNRLMVDFNNENLTGGDRKAAEMRNFLEVYRLFEDNRSIFVASLGHSAQSADEEAGPSLEGIQSFLDAATMQQLKKYADMGQEPPFDIAMALRLTFGMLASSVLLKDWLFPGAKPSPAEVVSLVEKLVSRALDPQPPAL